MAFKQPVRLIMGSRDQFTLSFKVTLKLQMQQEGGGDVNHHLASRESKNTNIHTFSKGFLPRWCQPSDNN